MTDKQNDLLNLESIEDSDQFMDEMDSIMEANGDLENTYDYNVPVSKLSEKNQNKIGYLIQRVEEVTQHNAAAFDGANIWSAELDNLLREILIEVIEDYDLREVKFQFCTSGSLAKGISTPYSDIDAFVIVENEADVEKVKTAMNGYFGICQRIFDKNNQFSPDPIGINPAKFCGTPAQLANMVKNGEVADPLIFTRSVMGAKPIYGFQHSQLLDTFKRSIDTLNYKDFFNEAVNVFVGPKNHEKLNIKHDLLRPLDFILTGLRFEHGIPDEDDGKHLKVDYMVNKLLEKGAIPKEFAQLFTSTFKETIYLRRASHLEHRKEHDEVNIRDSGFPGFDSKQLRIMLDKVAILRGCAERHLQDGEGFYLTDVPAYKSKSFTADDMALNYKQLVHQSVVEQAKHFYELVESELESIEKIYKSSKTDKVSDEAYTNVIAALNKALDECHYIQEAAKQNPSFNFKQFHFDKIQLDCKARLESAKDHAKLSWLENAIGNLLKKLGLTENRLVRRQEAYKELNKLEESLTTDKPAISQTKEVKNQKGHL